MDSIFTYKDDIEGKIGIGKLPSELHSMLDDISKEYYTIIPDKNASTYHTWYDDMSPSIKSKVEKIQKNGFWNKLCDGSKCIKINVNEMDELYYSNPKNNMNKINLYGASGNYDIHKDCFYNFNGIKFYRVIIGLTDGNDNIITYFNNFDVSHKINMGDFIVFDFDKTTHQVIKEKEELTPRILLKIHFIVCENCNYTKEYVETIKQFYIFYEIVTRYFMKVGTDPKTFYQFFIGLGCQLMTQNCVKYILFALIVVLLILFQVVLKIKLLYKNIPKIIKLLLLYLFASYIVVVFFYWLRYTLFHIK